MCNLYSRPRDSSPRTHGCEFARTGFERSHSARVESCPAVLQVGPGYPPAHDCLPLGPQRAPGVHDRLNVPPAPLQGHQLSNGASIPTRRINFPAAFDLTSCLLTHPPDDKWSSRSSGAGLPLSPRRILDAWPVQRGGGEQWCRSPRVLRKSPKSVVSRRCGLSVPRKRPHG